MNGRRISSETTEQDLIDLSLQEDRQAFGELVRRHRGGVVNVVYRMCADPNLAEEAAQEAFIRAWQRLGSYRPQFSFRTWVFRIAINCALDRLRREPETVAIETQALGSHSANPEITYEGKERINAVRQAILGLPPASRAVLILREYESLSYQEIAHTLGIPVGTVMSRLNYARHHLRQSLAVYLEKT